MSSTSEGTAENVRLEAVVRKKNNNNVCIQIRSTYGNILVDSLVENVFFQPQTRGAVAQEPANTKPSRRKSQPTLTPEYQDDTVRWRFIVSDFTFAMRLVPPGISPLPKALIQLRQCVLHSKWAGFYACAASFGISNRPDSGEDVSIILYGMEWGIR